MTLKWYLFLTQPKPRVVRHDDYDSGDLLRDHHVLDGGFNVLVFETVRGRRRCGVPSKPYRPPPVYNGRGGGPFGGGGRYKGTKGILALHIKNDRWGTWFSMLTFISMFSILKNVLKKLFCF